MNGICTYEGENEMMNSWIEIKCNAESITFVDDCDAVISEYNSKDICSSNLYIYSVVSFLEGFNSFIPPLSGSCAFH